MVKKRTHKIMIMNVIIGKVPRIKYKNIAESEYNTIQELARNILRFSKNENNSHEVAITYGMERIQKGEEYIRVAFGSEQGVDPISNYSHLSKELIETMTPFILNQQKG